MMTVISQLAETTIADRLLEPPEFDDEFTEIEPPWSTSDLDEPLSNDDPWTTSAIEQWLAQGGAAGELARQLW